MATSKSKRVWSIIAALFLLSFIQPVSSSSPPHDTPSSQLLANDIRRRSGSPDRPVVAGPPQKRSSNGITIIVSNRCQEALWPAIDTQAGTGAGIGGFMLEPGTSRNLTVGDDWAGRVWGRTNCTFNANGTASSQGSGPACSTGDCGAVMSCKGVGDTPATLAEWDMAGSVQYYDLSLVDGYNLPMGITYLPGQNGSLQEVPPNFTNLACIATAGLVLAPSVSGTLGNASNSSYPIPYESTQSSADIAKWCPWDLQQTPPPRPGYGVFPYPVDNIARPPFDPCLSACAKTKADSDCCTGQYNDPKKCKPSLYSTKAKAVCPDAYSYAYDDATSTFSVPKGGGWEVTFCPSGRSTNILKTFRAQLGELGEIGHDPSSLMADARNLTIIAEGGRENGGEKTTGERMGETSLVALVVIFVVVVLW